MIRKSSILITGAGGEVGSELIKILSHRQDVNLVTLDLHSISNKNSHLISDQITGNILDGNLLNQINLEFEIKEIYHLAAILSTRAELSPKIAHDVNINGTINLLELAMMQTKTQNKPVKFFFPSSIAVYGTNNYKNAVVENEYLNPITIYGCNKLYAEKLGLYVLVAATDEPLTKELGEILQLAETDMTIFYRLLALVDSTADPATMIDTTLLNAYYQPEQLNSEYRERMTGWLTQYQARIGQDDLAPGTRRQRMYAVNPKYVMRNYLAQLAIDKAAMGDYNMVNELLDVMRHPYDEQPDKEEYAQKRPDWARHRAGCSMLSCSS